MNPASRAVSALPRHRAVLGLSVTGVARLLVRIGLDAPLLRASAAVLHRAPGMRVAHSAGWHLGQAAGDRPRVARLRSGSRMVVDVRDYAHRYALLFGVYEEEVTRLITRVSRPGWTVLDVGANAGYFSLLAADLGGRGSRVVAFEPNPHMVELLRRSASLNRCTSLEIVQAACGDHEGQVTLRLSSDPRNTGLSTVRETSGCADRVPVALLRLDEFCASRGLLPDLVKIDVEGAETGVLLGAEALLREGCPAHVVCELWAESRDEMVEYMGGLSYVVHAILPDGSLTPAGPVQAQWQNVCFRHEGADTLYRSPGRHNPSRDGSSALSAGSDGSA